MRLSPIPAPSLAEFGALRVLELVRVFPEMTKILSDLGFDPGEHHEMTVREVELPVGKSLEDLHSELMWRGGVGD